MEYIFQAIKFLVCAIGAFVILLALVNLYRKCKEKLIGRLEYTREFSEEEVSEGESVYVTEIIYNPTIIPMFFIDVVSYIDGSLKLEGHDAASGMQEVISRFHLFPFTRETRRHKVICTHRGHFRMTSAAVMERKRTWDYDKIFKFETELFVLPKQIEYPYSLSAVNFTQGAGRSDNKIIFDPFSMVGIRDYAYGDPFNRINFKATARCAYQGIRGIKINELDSCSERIIMIYVNFEAPLDYDGAASHAKKMEYALSLAAYMINEATRAGYRVGFAANCPRSDGGKHVFFPAASGHYHAKEITREISMIPVRCESSFYTLLAADIRRNVSNTEAFIITPCMEDDVERAINILERRNAVTVIKI